jgi:DNA-binding transcriptional MerR regulator/methylmalonyl-CoA mutase cobalamin-binding subunit
MELRHTIKAASIRTGLSPHLIRMWEKRYCAVTPRRTASNRRIYSDEDLYKLILLRRATEAGESIGQVAGLKVEELESLLQSLDFRSATDGLDVAGTQGKSVEKIIADCLASIEELDEKRLLDILLRAASDKSRTELLNAILDPLMQQVGDRWQGGSLSVAHEHMVTAVVRSLLGSLVVTERVPQSAPILLATTPEGQNHEFGAMMAAITASAAGWRALYLGPNLPAEDIAGAVHQSGARAVALSMVYPPDDAAVGVELKKLRVLIGPDVVLIVGGRASHRYGAILEKIDAHIVNGLTDLMHFLGRVRNRAGRH